MANNNWSTWFPYQKEILHKKRHCTGLQVGQLIWRQSWTFALSPGRRRQRGRGRGRPGVDSWRTPPTSCWGWRTRVWRGCATSPASRGGTAWWRCCTHPPWPGLTRQWCRGCRPSSVKWVKWVKWVKLKNLGIFLVLNIWQIPQLALKCLNPCLDGMSQNLTWFFTNPSQDFLHTLVWRFYEYLSAEHELWLVRPECVVLERLHCRSCHVVIREYVL